MDLYIVNEMYEEAINVIGVYDTMGKAVACFKEWLYERDCTDKEIEQALEDRYFHGRNIVKLKQKY